MAGTTDMIRDDRYALVPVESDDPDMIRRQIEHTRAQLTSTINAIGERLSPENLIEQAKTSVREATVGRIKDMSYQANRRVEGMSNSLGDTMRANPLPVALVGIGLGWLALATRSKRSGNGSDMSGNYSYRSEGYRYYEEPHRPGAIDQARYRVNEAGEAIQDKAAEVGSRISQTAQRVGDTVGDAAQRVSEGVSGTAQRVGETVSDTAQRVGESVGQRSEMIQERASDLSMHTRSEAERLANEARWRAQAGVTRTRETFWESMEQNPLAIGAVMLLAGAAIGAVIPSTEYENRLMGETRDRLMNEAKTRAQDTVERVQTVVGEAQQAAITEARNVAERENLPIGRASSDTSTSGMGSY